MNRSISVAVNGFVHNLFSLSSFFSFFHVSAVRNICGLHANVPLLGKSISMNCTTSIA